MRLRSTRLTAIANAIRDKFYGAALNMRFDNTTSLDRRITFSRTTNATLTGSNGLIQSAPMNLLTFSEQFDNAVWNKSNTSVTANSTAAPDGSSTADTLAETATTSTHVLFGTIGTSTRFSVVSGVKYAFSVFLKKGSGATAPDVVQVGYGATGFPLTFYANFDLVSGSVTATGVGASSSSIEPVGNGWYRCIVVGEATSTTSANTTLAVAFTNNNPSATREPSYAGTTTSDVFVWGAQVELGSTATTYNPTTVKNLLGFTENFDNAAWTKSNSFVQTNLVTYSEQFDNAAWNKQQSSVQVNAVAAPDGTLTADKLIEDTANSLHRINRASNTTIVATTAYTISGYFKAAGRSIINFLFTDNITTFAREFNLADGTSTDADGGLTPPTSWSITPVGDGWYRCSLTATSGASTVGNWQVRMGSSTGVFSYTGDGTSGIYLWGAQLVQGTSAGDYKATYAAAAAVGYTDIYGQPFAQKLVENTATANHEVSAATVTIPVGTPVTYSVFAKAGERGYIFVALYDTQTNAAYFNLNTGAVVSTSGGVTANITAVGNGWYRCAITRTASANVSAYCRTSVTGTSTSYTGDGTSGIYIFGAQLSDSASVDPYVYQPVAAPSSVAYYGPRFDYDPVTLAPKGLLIEEQRTNLLLQSEAFETASWSKTTGGVASAPVVTANAGIAPDGTTTADQVVFNLNGGTTSADISSIAATAQAYSAGVSLTQSVYLKTTDGTSKAFTYVNIDGTTSTITVTGVWQRFTATVTPPAGGTSSPLRLRLRGSESTAPSASIYMWGAQLEAGAFATSYIPTVASQVTRAADSASMIGNNFARWYNQTEGTLFSDFDWLGLTSNDYCFSIGTDGNNFMGLGVNTSGGSRFIVVSGGAAQASYSFSGLTVNVPVKLAGAYKLNDFNAAAAGAVGTTDTSGIVPSATYAQFNSSVGGGNDFNGHLRRIAYYNRRLSNTELQGITS